MYIFDTSAFITMGHYYPSRFPSLWDKMDELLDDHKIWSVKDVRRELEIQSHFQHIDEWVKRNSQVFRKPTDDEMKIVSLIFKRNEFLALVRTDKILKGLPVADPFVVAAAKVHDSSVVTQEKYKKGGARIPTVCRAFDVKCINVEKFLELEKIRL